jgi:uncharacterized lipoprotein YmbA
MCLPNGGPFAIVMVVRRVAGALHMHRDYQHPSAIGQRGDLSIFLLLVFSPVAMIAGPAASRKTLMIVKRLPLTLLLTGLLMLTGCSHLMPVSYYQLDGGPVASKTADKDGMSVLLGPITVADYLQRETLLQRQDDGSLSPALTSRWAGSLATDLDRQVLRQLSNRINSQRLVLASDNPNYKAQVQVLLSITRLDSGPRQPAVLEGQWRLVGRDGQLLDTRLVHLEEKHKGPVADQVRAQSEVVQRLVSQLAGAVKNHANTPIAAEEPRRKAPVPAARQEPPKMPVAEPIRIDAEVFRF